MASPPPGSPPDPRTALSDAFAACRAGTLARFEELEEALFRRQVHPDFSPVGWHLGHVVYTESLWLVARCGRRALPFPEFEKTFAVDGLDKSDRVNIPPPGAVLDYAAAVRAQTLECLDTAPLEEQERVWRFVLQHECQHTETIAFLERLESLDGADTAPACRTTPEPHGLLPVPGGAVTLGYDGPDAMDNEAPVHEVLVEDFRIARHPVSQAQYRAFMDAGGYQERAHWTEAGWNWRTREGVSGPLYWNRDSDEAPVCGVSAHEAEAYCRFAGLRLPTEAEWEKAAAWSPDTGRAHLYPWGGDAPRAELCNHDGRHSGTTPVGAHPGGRSAYGAEDMLGNVWEWTSSAFAPYPGFSPFPYAGYSAAYFDGRHRVLRGGSWATRSWPLRASWRNWYVPETRQILAGFRCAKDGLGD